MWRLSTVRGVKSLCKANEKSDCVLRRCTWCSQVATNKSKVCLTPNRIFCAFQDENSKPFHSSFPPLQLVGDLTWIFIDISFTFACHIKLNMASVIWKRCCRPQSLKPMLLFQKSCLCLARQPVVDVKFTIDLSQSFLLLSYSWNLSFVLSALAWREEVSSVLLWTATLV